MTTLLVSKFKARCAEVLAGVHDTGEPVLITRRGKPLARIVPVSPPREPRRRLGATPGEMVFRGDIVHGNSSGDWESLQ